MIHRAISIKIKNHIGFRWHRLCDLSSDTGYGECLSWDWDEVTCNECKQVGMDSNLTHDPKRFEHQFKIE